MVRAGVTARTLVLFCNQLIKPYLGNSPMPQDLVSLQRDKSLSMAVCMHARQAVSNQIFSVDVRQQKGKEGRQTWFGGLGTHVQHVGLMSIVTPSCRSGDEERPDVSCIMCTSLAWGFSQDTGSADCAWLILFDTRTYHF